MKSITSNNSIRNRQKCNAQIRYTTIKYSIFTADFITAVKAIPKIEFDVWIHRESERQFIVVCMMSFCVYFENEWIFPWK